MPDTNGIEIPLMLNMSMCYMDLRDYSNALKLNLKALEVYQNKESDFIDETDKLPILRNMSDIYIRIGKWKDALNLAQESLKLSKKLFGDEHRETVKVRLILSECYRNLNQYDKALEIDKKNYEVCKKIFGDDGFNKINSLFGIAKDYEGLGDEEAKWSTLKEILNYNQRIFGDKSLLTLNFLSIVAKEYMKNPDTVDKAIELSQSILNTMLEILPEDDPQLVDSIYNLARAYNNSPYWLKAIPLYDDVIARYEDLSERYSYLTATEKRRLFSELLPVYSDTMLLHFSNRNYQEAFRVLELSRARNLIDLYSEQLAKNSNIFTDEEIAKLNEYSTKLSEYDNLLHSSEQSGNEQIRLNLEGEHRQIINEYMEYKENLKKKYPMYYKASHSNKLDINQDKNILPDDTFFIEFMVDRVQKVVDYDITVKTLIVAFLLNNRGDLQAIEINADEEFLAICKFYRDLLAYKNLSDMRADNKYLWKLSNGNLEIGFGRQKPEEGAELVRDDSFFYELREEFSKGIGDYLLKPLEGYISNCSNLIISPDGDLNNIPFETLKFNGKNAVETFNISYVPSFAVLKLMHEAGVKNANLKDRQSLFAMGDAVYGDSTNSESRSSRGSFAELGHRSNEEEFKVEDLKQLQWNNLPGTNKELEQVSKFFDTKEILRQESASETNLKSFNDSGDLSKYKYLLFATHGIFVPFAPSLTSIVLSQGVDKDNDEYVTIGEWLGFDLNSDLVYLSACESGLGDYQAGEGIVGIPYALTIAGNKDTVMSLWKVDDEAAAEFSATFFKKLSQGKSEVIALNETKREFIAKNTSKYSDPSIWAAFLLYGI